MNKNMGRAQGSRYPPSQPGPLLTDHLQVRDLERELELLRYKREAIQREQQLLGLECEIERERQYEYTNPNISNTYGNIWQPSPPKRASTPQHGKQWMGPAQDTFGPKMSKRTPTNYIPSLLSKKVEPPIIPISLKPIVHPILQNTVAQRFLKPTNIRKDFNPNQIFKKKPRAPPNKLHSYPIMERKELVSKATASLSAKKRTNKPPEDPETMILREDRIPNKQVTGRLELALGNLFKEIRCTNDHNDKFKTLISNSVLQRTMKQAIRERIRSVMLNKTVGSVADIIKQYREEFPQRTDQDIVELVINSERPKLVTVLQTESPEEFFNKNISSILKMKVQEMSSNLLMMYSTGRRKPAFAYTKAANKTQDENDSDNQMAMKVLRGIAGKYVAIEERDVLTKYYTKLIEKILEEKLPEYLSQCSNHFLKIFDMDRQIKHIKLITSKIIKGEVVGNVTLNNENDEISDNNDKLFKELSDIQMEEEAANERNVLESDAVTENKDMECDAVTENNGSEDDTITKNKDLEGDTVPDNNDTGENTQTESILRNEVVTAVVDKTLEITEEKPVSVGAEESTAKSITVPIKTELSQSFNTPVIKSTALTKELQYYVKLIGRPTLPNRAAICDFLNHYRPSSIKKHKSIRNLLVVGLNNQEDYNKILSANETVIGDITILIKASEKVNSGKENVSINEGNDEKIETQTEINDDANTLKKEINDGTNTIKKEIHESANNSKEEINEDANNIKTENDKDIIGKELDDQITELLSTITETDEETMESKNEKNDKVAESIETGDGLSQESNHATRPCEPTKDGKVEIRNDELQKAGQTDKVSKVKESGRSTPVRSSSRLANATPSTIRTRRASRLLQE